MDPMPLGVLASGTGTNLQAIIDASHAGTIPVQVCVVVSDRKRAQALDRARMAGIPAVYVSRTGARSQQCFEEELLRELWCHGATWVALAGFMRILGGAFLGSFADRVVNIHPSLLPAFPGLHAQRQALDYGVKVAGCTVHFVDGGTDTGPIIAQRSVLVRADDDEARLSGRILAEEHRLYPWVLGQLALGRVRRVGRRVLTEGEEPLDPGQWPSLSALGKSR
jgi:phosphoribosylglycinamide formyltransferase-1